MCPPRDSAGHPEPALGSPAHGAVSGVGRGLCATGSSSSVLETPALGHLRTSYALLHPIRLWLLLSFSAYWVSCDVFCSPRRGRMRKQQLEQPMTFVSNQNVNWVPGHPLKGPGGASAGLRGGSTVAQLTPSQNCAYVFTPVLWHGERADVEGTSAKWLPGSVLRCRPRPLPLQLPRQFGVCRYSSGRLPPPPQPATRTYTPPPCHF